MQPAQRRVGRRHAERLLAQHRDCAVVDLLALVVAPRRVEHLADFRFAHVARDDVIEQSGGITTGDEVLVERGDVEQRRDRKSTRLNSSHSQISYAVFCLKKKKKRQQNSYCYAGTYTA